MYDVNCLAQCLEKIKGSPSGTHSLNYKLQGENGLVIVYSAIVHFASDSSLRDQTKRELEISNSMISDAIKSTKKSYKESCGSSLKVTEMTSDDNVEIISTTFHSPRRVGMYKRTVIFKVE